MACGSGIAPRVRAVFDPCGWNPVLGRYPHAVGGGCATDEPVDYIVETGQPVMPGHDSVEFWRVDDPIRGQTRRLHDLACTVYGTWLPGISWALEAHREETTS
jgi:hypothetical protein